MVIRHTELKKMEQLYEKNGNQLVLLYGREGCIFVYSHINMVSMLMDDI